MGCHVGSPMRCQRNEDGGTCPVNVVGTLNPTVGLYQLEK